MGKRRKQEADQNRKRHLSRKVEAETDTSNDDSNMTVDQKDVTGEERVTVSGRFSILTHVDDLQSEKAGREPRDY